MIGVLFGFGVSGGSWGVDLFSFSFSFCFYFIFCGFFIIFVIIVFIVFGCRWGRRGLVLTFLTCYISGRGEGLGIITVIEFKKAFVLTWYISGRGERLGVAIVIEFKKGFFWTIGAGGRVI